MADRDPIPDEALFLVASNPVLTASTCSEWNRRMADWLRWTGLNRADSAFGKYAILALAHELAEARTLEKFGGQRGSNPAAVAELRTTWAALEAYEQIVLEQFDRPLWRAAALLAQTPAPNLTAALFKIQLIKREDLDADANMERDAFDVVVDDMARLGTPIDEDPASLHAEAERAFGRSEIDEDAYITAHEGVKTWKPTNLREFARKFVALYDNGGFPASETRDCLVREARQLTGQTIAN